MIYSCIKKKIKFLINNNNIILKKLNLDILENKYL